MKCLCILSVCLLLTGCGGKPYEGPKRIPLTGKITFDGEPVDGGVISFISQNEGGRPTGGPIMGGEYKIAENQGANEGVYRVEITWNKPTGKQVKDTADTGEMVNEVKQVIPDQYNVKSELTAEVAADKTEFNFELTSK